MQIKNSSLSQSLRYASPPSSKAASTVAPDAAPLHLDEARVGESSAGLGKILGGVALLGLALGAAGCTPQGGAPVQQETTVPSQNNWTPGDLDMGVDRSHNTGISSDGTVTSRIGNTTVNSNGKVSTRVGQHTVVDSDGRISTEIGNTIIRSDGTVGTRVGNSVINSDGTVSTRIGNTVINSDGTIGFQF